MLVRKGYLTVSKPLPHAPGYVLRNRTALFLGKAGHYRNQQLTFGVKGPDVFLLEIDLHTGFFQFSDGGQAVDRISGKAADRLGDDQVDLSSQGILDHLIETVTAFCAGAGDALVSVDFNELPIGVAQDVLGVIVDLGFIASELLVAVC